jgi:hypothetical protein
MATQIVVGTVKRFNAIFTDANDVPTTVDVTNGPPVAEVSDPALLELLEATPTPNGLAGRVRVAGLGAAQLRVTGDADRGSGVRALTLTADIEGIPGEAVGGRIDLSDDTP